VISGNGGSGAFITDAGSNANDVLNDLLGTDALGTKALGNGDGVVIASGASNNSVTNDVLSANYYGVIIKDAGTNGNFLQNDRIGTDVKGNPLGNMYGLGVFNTTCSVYFCTIEFNAIDGVLTAGVDPNVFNATFIGNTVFFNKGQNIVNM
jgi:hypothetical protein